jgi:hypothetical protein
VSDVDWEHVVEEIEDVGLSELNAVHRYLRLRLVHLLKLQGSPDNAAAGHWRRNTTAEVIPARLLMVSGRSKAGLTGVRLLLRSALRRLSRGGP